MKTITTDYWCEITPGEIDFGGKTTGTLGGEVNVSFEGKGMILKSGGDINLEQDEEDEPGGMINDDNIVQKALWISKAEGFFEGKKEKDGIVFDLSEVCADPE